MKHRNVLVTGATGFIGKYVVNELINDRAELFILTRNIESIHANNHRFQLVKGDITEKIQIPQDISTIFHCAGSISTSKDMYSVNVVGTSQIVDAAIKNNCKLVHLSSAGVIGSPTKRIIDESSACNPQNLYEKTKYEAEQIVLQGVKSGLRATILRPTIVFGIGRNPEQDSFLHLLRAIKSGKYHNICNGKGIYNIVHAREVARAMIELEKSNKQSGEIYFINNPISFNKFSEIVSQTIKCKKPNNISFPFAFTLTAFCSIASKLTSLNLPLSWSRLNALTNSTSFSQSLLLKETSYMPDAEVEKYIEDVCKEYISQCLL